MSSEDFLYRYKKVETTEIKTLLQKNTQDHYNDMKIAVDTILQNEDKITVVVGDWNSVTFKKSLLIMFSKTMRSCLASLSCCSEPTIFLPDCSTESVSKVQDILEKQFTETKGKSFKDTQTVLEAANALGIDIDNLDYVARVNPSIKAREDVSRLSEEEPESSNHIIYSNYETTKYEAEVTKRILIRANTLAKWSGSDSSNSSPRVLPAKRKKKAKIIGSKKKDVIVAEKKELKAQKHLPSDAIDEFNKHSHDRSSEEEECKDYEDESSSDGGIQDIIKSKVKTASESVSADETMTGETISEDEEPSDEGDENAETNKILLSRKGLRVILPSNLQECFSPRNMYKVPQSETSLEEASENTLIGKNSSKEYKSFNMTKPDESVLSNDLTDIEKVSSERQETNNSVVNNEVPRQEASVNENRFRCTLCKNVMRKLAVSTFKEHYSTVHFHKEIFEMYIGDPAETVCRVDGCGREFEAKNKGNLVRHIGSTHNKVVEILQLKGMEVPVVLTENNVSNKRKRSEIQSERANKQKT